MGLTNLEGLFRPSAVAVAGASNEPRTVGNSIMRHLLAGKFLGPVLPLTPDEDEVLGLTAYATVDTLPLTPDLAILCVPPELAPHYLEQLGRRGVKAAVALCPGYAKMRPDTKRAVSARMLEAARRHGIRMLGPSGLGLILPGLGLNASLVPADPPKGRIAFVSQSASLFTAVLDWGRDNAVGFSHVVSLGDRVDLEYHDILDYLAADPSARAILLYVESIGNARGFMSAARAAARTKPVLVVKPGRGVSAGPGGEPQGLDEVYSEAFRRAGVLRIGEMDTLFDAAKTLARGKPLGVGNLAVLTNGGSLGVMCADTLVAGGARLAEISPATGQALTALVGPNWDRGNVVDMGCTAKARHYREALAALLKDPGPSAVLVVHVPFAMVPAEEVAQAVAELAARTGRPVLCCFIGRGEADAARGLLAKAGLPVFDTPEKAARAYLHMAGHRRTQELLMEMPGAQDEGEESDHAAVAGVLESVLETGRLELTEPEAKVVLAAYGVPVMRTLEAVGEQGVLEAALTVGYPVALTALSDRVEDPLEAGLALYDLEDSEELAQAVATLQDRAGRLGDLTLDHFTVRAAGRRSARELLLEARVDPVFGPFLRLGPGGAQARFLAERAVALPPLNANLAADLAGRTRAAANLPGEPGQAALCRAIVALSRLMTEAPQIVAVDIHPLLVDAHGAAAQGARIRLAPSDKAGPDRLAIRPYPRELEARALLETGREVLVRPIRPEDEAAHYEFFRHISPQDQRLRFFSVMGELTHQEMVKLTQIDYEREMAFIATAQGPDDAPETLGEVRISAKPDNASAEYAILIRSDMQGIGIGRILTDRVVRYCRGRGIRSLTGHILIENKNMLALARNVGFELRRDDEEGVYEMFMDLLARET